MSTTDLIAGISGGRTSAYMAFMLPPETILAFQNTGEEHEKTLEFLCRVEDDIGRPIVRLEWRPPPNRGDPPRLATFEIVTHQTLARKGEPFRELLETLKEGAAVSETCEHGNEYDCRECSAETAAEYAARADRFADRNAVLALLRQRWPHGPLAAHVAGLLARDAASRALREAERLREETATGRDQSEHVEAMQAEMTARTAWREAEDARAAVDALLAGKT